MKILGQTLILLILLTILSCSGKKEEELKNNEVKTTTHKIEVIAHAGGGKLGPYNTIATFKKALEVGVDMIELDVRLSEDDYVVVVHDPKIKGHDVNKMTLSEIREFDVGSWFDEKFKDERIPTLDKIMELVNGKTKLLIEIKNLGEIHPGLEKKVVETIYKYKASNWVIVQSFNLNSVLRIKKIDPNIPTFYLFGRSFENFGINFEDFYADISKKVEDGKTVTKQFDGISPHFASLNPERVKVLHKAGFKIYAWTVDEPEDMKNLIQMNVDGIITDSPVVLKKLLGR